MTAPIEDPFPRVAAQTRLLQFASQALPTGAYAYSVGLEGLLSSGKLEGESACQVHLVTLMESVVARLEIPLFLRMFAAFQGEDAPAARRASEYLLASRETREMQEQERQMARALRRVLGDICADRCPGDWSPVTYSEGLARTAHWFELERSEAAVLLVYSWVEQQVSALCRLLPLGPIAGQRMLNGILIHVPGVVALGATIEDDDMGAGAPGLAIASARHENQYCRIFRS
jgi:urease accessory protein